MRNLFLLCVLAVCIALSSGCKGKSTTPTALHRPEATAVTVTSVTNAAWDRTVSVVGTLYAKDSATIGAQVEGQVEKTLVDFGDRVKAGQDLALIDTASYEALLQQAEGS